MGVTFGSVFIFAGKSSTPSMKPYYQQDTHTHADTQSKLRPLLSLFRAIVLTTLIILFVSLGVGLFWGWDMTLPSLLGGLLFACCCFLSYYGRISFSFNNITDIHQAVFSPFSQTVYRAIIDLHPLSRNPFSPSNLSRSLAILLVKSIKRRKIGAFVPFFGKYFLMRASNCFSRFLPKHKA